MALSFLNQQGKTGGQHPSIPEDLWGQANDGTMRQKSGGGGVREGGGVSVLVRTWANLLDRTGKQWLLVPTTAASPPGAGFSGFRLIFLAHILPLAPPHRITHAEPAGCALDTSAP